MSAYVPDHIRLTRTDRLWHIRESFQTVMRRHLPHVWEDQATYNIVLRYHREIKQIDDELHYRRMKLRFAYRQLWTPQYDRTGR